MDIFFNSLEYLGNLFLEQVFLDFEDEPVVFVCRDSRDGLYLCICTEIRNLQRWAITKTNLSAIYYLLSGRIDTAECYKLGGIEKYIIESIDEIESIKRVNYNELDTNLLPRKGGYIKPAFWTDGTQEYLESIKKELELAKSKYIFEQALIYQDNPKYEDIYMRIAKSIISDKLISAISESYFINDFSKYRKIISQWKISRWKDNLNSIEKSCKISLKSATLENNNAEPNSIGSDNTELIFAA